jgi:hypothetical protein
MTFPESRRIVVTLGAVAALLSAARAQAQVGPIPVPLFKWTYTVKFVCGLQPPVQQPGETIVKPANYATEVNIFNPMNVATPIRKRVILLVEKGEPIGREPAQQGPRGFDNINLNRGYATMDDCNRLWQLTHPTQPLPMPMPLTIGFLVLDSPRELDVDAVYTAGTPGFAGAVNHGISIDVERVPGRRVSLLTPVPTDPIPSDPSPDARDESAVEPKP